MKTKLPFKLSFLLTIISYFSYAQSLYFPPVSGTQWETTAPASLGYCDGKIDSLYHLLEQSNSKAFILLQDGKIVLEKYFGTFTQDSAWYWASAGKSLTAFLVGIAQREGHFSITDTSSKYLGTGWTNLTPVQEEKITIWHQLTMTSGLDDGVPDHYCTLDTCLNYKADPGTRWAYHNGPYTLLDKVIQNSTGQTMNNFLNQKLSVGTGISGLFLPSGYNNVFFSKARSMARFGLLMLADGIWDGSDMLQDASYFNNMINSSQNLNLSYGYLWWLNGKASYMLPSIQFVIPGYISPHAPADMYAALGKNGQIINVVPSKKMVWIRMGNDPGVGEVPSAFNDEVWKKINDLPCTTSVLRDEEKQAFSLYPNPSSNYLRINFNAQNTAPQKLLIFDALGQVIVEKEVFGNQIEISTQALRKGIYTARILYGNQKAEQQFFVKN